MRIAVSTAAMIAKRGYLKGITLIGTTRKLVKQKFEYEKVGNLFSFFCIFGSYC
jgi:hypothetical protein